MKRIYFESRYKWRQVDLLSAYDVLNDFLVEATNQEVFSVPEDLFDTYDSAFTTFFHTLTSNNCLRAAFCDIFPLLWENNPNNDLLTNLVIRDFSEPSMVSSLGMEQFGFEDPEEDFQKIIIAFRNTAKRGFLTTSNQVAAVSGRVHLDFSYLKTILLESNWPGFNEELWAFEKELNSIEVPWKQMVDDEPNHVLSFALYEFFGRFEDREVKENEVTTTGCLQMDSDWRKALRRSTEIVLAKSSEEELDRLVKVSTQFSEMENSATVWLKSFLDYTTTFDQETFYKLYH